MVEWSERGKERSQTGDEEDRARSLLFSHSNHCSFNSSPPPSAYVVIFTLLPFSLPTFPCFSACLLLSL